VTYLTQLKMSFITSIFIFKLITNNTFNHFKNKYALHASSKFLKNSEASSLNPQRTGSSPGAGSLTGSIFISFGGP
jgi:hypothetical protein